VRADVLIGPRQQALSRRARIAGQALR